MRVPSVEIGVYGSGVGSEGVRGRGVGCGVRGVGLGVWGVGFGVRGAWFVGQDVGCRV